MLFWTPPSEYPNLKEAQYVAVDLECRDERLGKFGPGGVRGDGYVVGIAVAAIWSDGSRYKGYFPFEHELGGNLDKTVVLEWARDNLHTSVPKVGHNFSYDLEWLSTVGIDLTQARLHDTQIQACILNENRLSYKLDDLAEAELGRGKDESILRMGCKNQGLKSVKDNIWVLHAGYVADYAARDAEAALDLFLLQQKQIEEQGLSSIYELESQLIPVLHKMRLKGVPVDSRKAQDLSDEWTMEERRKHDELNNMAGFEVNIDASADLKRAFDKLRIPYSYTAPTAKFPEGQPSFAKKALQSQEHEPFVALMLEVAKIHKIRRDFIDPLTTRSVHGRMHTQFNQLKKTDETGSSKGTVTGRLSSSNPNLQNQPGNNNKVWKQIVRSCFVADPGYTWCKADYSQQEARLFIHYAYKMGMEGAKEAVEAFRSDPTTDYHQMVANMGRHVEGFTRDKAKTTNFGILYGQGVALLTTNLRMTEAEAYAFLESYHDAIPYAKGMANLCASLAEKRGFIRTIGGRLCRFDSWVPARDYKATPLPYEQAMNTYKGQVIKRAGGHKALNRLIQGSAADMTKMAMLNIYKGSGMIPYLQVHDELDYPTESVEQQEYIKYEMEHAVELELPVVCDITTGNNWAECA